MRAIKVRAAKEDRRLKDVVSELLRRGLASEERPIKEQRVKLPLIHSKRQLAPGEGITPEELDKILLEQEVAWALGRSDPASS